MDAKPEEHRSSVDASQQFPDLKRQDKDQKEEARERFKRRIELLNKVFGNNVQLMEEKDKE